MALPTAKEKEDIEQQISELYEWKSRMAVPFNDANVPCAWAVAAAPTRTRAGMTDNFMTGVLCMSEM